MIVFNWLDRKALSNILEITLSDLNRRLVSRNVTVRLSPEVEEFILDIGFDRRFGARYLKRSVRRHIENPLARLIVSEPRATEPLTMVAVRESGSSEPGKSVSFTIEANDDGSLVETEPDEDGLADLGETAHQADCRVSRPDVTHW